MDVSRMIKRATGDVKYMAIAAIVGLQMLIVAFSIVQMFSYGFFLLNFVSSVVSLITLACLLIYALDSHGTVRSKKFAYAHYGLSLFSSIVLNLIVNLVGGVSSSNLFLIPSYLIAASYLAFLYFGIRGIPVFAVTALSMGIGVFSSIQTYAAAQWDIHFMSYVFLAINTACIFVRGYLVATDKK